MNNLAKLKMRAVRLGKAIESCRDMGWGDTADFYSAQLVKLESEIKDTESFIKASAKTKGLPIPVATY